MAVFEGGSGGARSGGSCGDITRVGVMDTCQLGMHIINEDGVGKSSHVKVVGKHINKVDSMDNMRVE